jgi:PilZ domain
MRRARRCKTRVLMSTPTPADLLQLALGVFPPLPTIVEVLSEDGGGFALRIAAREDELLHAYGPRTQMRKELRLLSRITDAQRGRYEIEFEVAAVFYHSATDALLHLTVTGVHHRKMRRASPRVAVSERAHARVLFCRTLPRDSRLDLRLADISATGVAFTGMRQLDPGDLLLISTRIGGLAIHFEARVVRSDPAPYGRFRTGCEIIEFAADARESITAIAMSTPENGSEDQRRPETAEAMAQVRTAEAGLLGRIQR